MTYIVQFSGGVGSWAAARRLVDQHGIDAVSLLVADTNSEADDWWPFVEACQADLGCRMVHLDNGGRTIWDVFEMNRFIGNTKVDLCSRVLKREPLRAWLDAHADPETDVVVIGFDWTEEHRFERAKGYWTPWSVVAPLCDAPYVEKPALLAELVRRGIPVPSLYLEGFPHNNCGGACVKAGQAQWAMLYRKRPETFADAEAHEEKLRGILGDVAILKDRRGGATMPLTLGRFRERLDRAGEQLTLGFDQDDWGACSCMDNPGSEG